MGIDSIELPHLLAPLNIGEGSAGTDMRLDFTPTSPYQRLRDARAQARAEERARDADEDPVVAPAEGWRTVLSIAQQTLATQTKDIEIAAWLTEALVRIYGLPGLAAGATIIAGLCEAFWDSGFPRPDEDGLEARAVPIGGLSGSSGDGTIMQPLRRLALFRRTDGTGFGVYLWEQAEQTASLSEERRQAKYAAGAPELKTLQAEAGLDRAFLTATWQQATAALQAWTELDRIVEVRFGSEAPSLRNVSTLLRRMLDVLTRLGGEPSRSDVTVTDDAAGGHTSHPTKIGNTASTEVAGPHATGLTREDALRELGRIADYFRRIEPHSPLAYTLEEAIRRGRMTLAELLVEILPDKDVRNGMLMRLGIRPDSD